MRARRRGSALLAFGAMVVVAPVLLLAAPAQAHNYLVESTPAAGSVLTALPAEFSVTTNDVLLDVTGRGDGFALQVKDDKGLYYGDGCVRVDGPEMSTTAAIGAPGKYQVVWQLISADGHTVSNEFSFTWQPSPTDAVVSKGSKTPPNCNGTQSVGAGSSATTPAPTATVDNSENLGTVLWIGGAIVAVGAAVVVTLLAVSRKRPKSPPAD